MRLPGIVGRYLYPARMVPPTRHNLERVAGSLAAAYARSDLAAAGPAAVGIDVSDACNIACAICAREVDRDPRRRALVSLDEFISTIRSGRCTCHCTVTGKRCSTSTFLP